MAIVARFKGLTYHPHLNQDISRLVTPPYDVIAEEEQEAYYEAHPYNIIRLILGRKRVGDTDWDNRYTRAADDFARWESQGVFHRADHPQMYLTTHEYDPGNGIPRQTRWGLIVLVRIEDEESKVILPHEKTFSAHKEDRLKLMRACNAQFSQIFGLFEDPQDHVLSACREQGMGSPTLDFDFKDGTRHRMWTLSDQDLFRRISLFLRDKAVFIADGHHRYETARNYRNAMRARYGLRPAHRAYEYVMMYLSNMSHPELTILPSHRLIRSVPDFRLPAFLQKMEPWFEISENPVPTPITPETSVDLKQRLEQLGVHTTVLAFCGKDSDRAYFFSLRDGARAAMGDDLHPSLKKLDVLVLSRFMLQQGLGFSKQDLDNDELFHYQSSLFKALEAVQSGQIQMAFLLNPTRIEHVKEIANNALVMPRKSTYFYPKVITGLVLNKIDPHEIIQAP